MKITKQQFRGAERKIVSLIGMSGCGKTVLARKLPSTEWFHYSADYRIGTRYLDEPIIDNIKEKAMQIPFLRDLLRSDSIRVKSAMTFDNLDLLSKFVGMLGDEQKGGLNLEEFRWRQKLHRSAEIRSMYDVTEFVQKAKSIYGYDHFVNDTSGSLCELGDEKVLEALARQTLILFIDVSQEFESEIINRQVQYPKPLYYESEFLDSKLAEYLETEELTGVDEIDPSHFVQWIFPDLVAFRRPKYERIAAKYGHTISAEKTTYVRDEKDFIDLVCEVLPD